MHSLSQAAGCILQFVGRYAFMAGIGKASLPTVCMPNKLCQRISLCQERRRCKEYIGWLLQQLKGGDFNFSENVFRLESRKVP